jgi:1-acyl-sn-glycerol-3-phosphate acyltransferase
VITPFENFALKLMRWANQSPITYVWQRYVLIPFVGLVFEKRLVVTGLERVPSDPQTRILLVANHRTFFDLFALGYILWRHKKLTQRLSFPVRATFFYENPLGLFLALFFSGGSMHPPFFRDASKKVENRAMLNELIDRMSQPAEIVGFHPEGTRNPSDDPYTFLPAKPGVGELALKSRPTVIPAYIKGLSNSFWQEVRGTSRIDAIFGDPIELPATEGELRLSHYKRTADLFMEKIAELSSASRSREPAPR